MLSPFTLGWGPRKAMSCNNSNKTTLHRNGTLQLACAFIYVIQIMQGASCGGRVGRGGFQGKIDCFCALGNVTISQPCLWSGSQLSLNSPEDRASWLSPPPCAPVASPGESWSPNLPQESLRLSSRPPQSGMWLLPVLPPAPQWLSFWRLC